MNDELAVFSDHWKVGDRQFQKEKHILHTVEGNEKRAIPGDIIHYKEDKEDGRPLWVTNEESHFLVLRIDDLEKEQMLALTEQEYDLNSYSIYSPMTFGQYKLQQEENVKNVPDVQLNSTNAYVKIDGTSTLSNREKAW